MAPSEDKKKEMPMSLRTHPAKESNCTNLKILLQSILQ